MHDVVTNEVLSSEQFSFVTSKPTFRIVISFYQQFAFIYQGPPISAVQAQFK